MEDFYFARQAIYNQQLEVYAYELLFRNAHAQHAEVTDGTRASSQVIINTLHDMGLESIVGDNLAFINFTRDLLIHEGIHQITSRQVVIEVLEDITPEPEVMEALQRLVREGYCIALDDFIYSEELQPLVELAQIIKIDILQLDEQQLIQHVQQLKGQGKRLLAEKIETTEQFEFCKSLGFDYFQGYFIARPHVIKGQRPPANRLATLHLLGRLQDPNVAFGELEELISKDLSLSYRILRIINSARHQLPRKIESIHTAVTLLGLKQLKHLASLIALANFDDKPSELLVMAMIRAKMAELLARQMAYSNPDAAFTVGLFSTLEALFNMPMEELVRELPLSDEVVAALLYSAGTLGEILALVLNYEKGDWDQLRLQSDSDVDLAELYLQSVQWSEQSTSELLGDATA